VPFGAGPPGNDLIGDAQVMSNWGHMSIDANPDMMKARRRVRNLEPEYRFCFPTAADSDPEISYHRRRQPAESATDIREGLRLPSISRRISRGGSRRSELSGGAHAHEMPEQRTVRDGA
jgi:hypothetical protein